jgi:hypothetical protein
MPTFRSAPSANLATSIKRLVASNRGQITPMQEMQVDQAAADTAHKTSLAEKVRLEAEEMRNAAAARANPAASTEFASHSAGINLDTGNRLMAHIRGQPEPYSTADADDAAVVGADVPRYTMAAPNIEPGQDRRFRSALAATIAERLAGGKTNAEQLTKAAGEVQGQGIMEAVQAAIGRGDYHGASAMNQGAKPGTQIKLHDNIGSTGATFAPATGRVAADPAADPTNKLLPATIASEAAQAEQRRAAAAASRASADKRNQPNERFRDVTTLRKEFNDQAEVKAFRDVIPIVEAARTTPDTRAGDIQIAYSVGKILDPASVVREGELKLVGTAATLPEKIQGEIRTLVMGKGRISPETRAELVKMLDAAVDQREKAYNAAEATYRGIAEKNGFDVNQVIINAPKRSKPGQPAGEVQARKKIGNVEFVKINGQWFQP